MRTRRFDPAYIAVPLALLLSVLTVCAFTGRWPWSGNDYNSYVLQCRSWLEGRLDLGRDYVWLELAIYEGKYFVSFPPFPSYVLLPFVALFGTAVKDGVIALCFSLLGAVAGVRLVRRLAPRRGWLLWLLLDWYLATGWLFIGVNAWVWFIAQSMCFALSMMALAAAADGRGALSLLFWACSVGCRPMMAVYLPILLWLLWKEERRRFPEDGFWQIVLRRWWWALPCTIVAVSYMVLNYCRFGSILEFGHNYLPEFTRVSTGQFNLSYIAGNIRDILKLPSVKADGTLSFPQMNGMAFWLADPMLFAALAAWITGLARAVRKKPADRFLLVAVPLCAAVHTFILLCHRTMGGWQFGCRYLVDMMPYWLAGVLLWIGDDDRLQHIALPAGTLGFALNLAGTIAAYNGFL